MVLALLYDEYMVRTKYLLVAILGCMAIIIGTGVSSLFPSASSRAEIQTAVFAVPNYSYSVITSNDENTTSDRDAFIEKVRKTLKSDPPPVIVEKAEPVPSQSELGGGDMRATTTEVSPIADPYRETYSDKIKDPASEDEMDMASTTSETAAP
jgi:hypothetical protein